MGNTTGRNAFATSESWTKLRARAHTLSMLDVLNASKSHDTISTGAMDRLPTISDDATVQMLVAALASTPNGAVLVTDRNGEIIDSVDLFRVVRYLLHLYEGSPMARGTGAVPGKDDTAFWCVVFSGADLLCAQLLTMVVCVCVCVCV